MDEYHELVDRILRNGTHKPNRTGVDTISTFSQHYKIDLNDGFPLLTTKDLSGFRWNSLIHELLWYLTGDEHIRNLREETSIWDAWADDEGRLDTAYGRFWRRFPIPNPEASLDGETWAGQTSTKWDNTDDINPDRWVSRESVPGDDVYSFDQIQYAIDMLNENPNSRRIVITAWHPANATVSTLPPCHYTWVLNVQDGALNTHLTQRSGDTALGVPFNIAAYSILTHIIAQRTGLDVGEFAHTIVDSHIYCGEGARGEWYGDHLDELKNRLANASTADEYEEIRTWVVENAPADPENLDHVPGLLRQLSRDPRDRPTLTVSDVPLDDLTFDDIELSEYNPYDDLKFGVAE